MTLEQMQTQVNAWHANADIQLDVDPERLARDLFAIVATAERSVLAHHEAVKRQNDLIAGDDW
jgi:phage shock protein A